MATQRLMSIGEVTEEVTERLRNYGLMESQSAKFEARTFHYYRSRGLLPEPEGSGPKARYPEAVLDIIVFVRRLQKERPDLSLEDVAGILPSIPEETVRSVARGKEPLVVRPIDPPRASSLRRSVVGPEARYDTNAGPLSSPAEYIQRAKAEFEPNLHRKSEKFHRIPLTEDVELNVRRQLGEKQLRQLAIIGELIKTILDPGGR